MLEGCGKEGERCERLVVYWRHWTGLEGVWKGRENAVKDVSYGAGLGMAGRNMERKGKDRKGCYVLAGKEMEGLREMWRE